MDGRHFRVQGLVGQNSGTGRAHAPLTTAGARHAQDLAKQADGVPITMLVDPGVLHRDLWRSMPSRRSRGRVGMLPAQPEAMPRLDQFSYGGHGPTNRGCEPHGLGLEFLCVLPLRNLALLYVKWRQGHSRPWLVSMRIAAGETRRMWLGTLRCAIHDTGDEPSFAYQATMISRSQTHL